MDNHCFANTNNKCQILKVDKCTGYSTCPFYKTEEDRKSSIKKAFRRLASLDELKQNIIADQYYNGKFPWKEGGVSYDS